MNDAGLRTGGSLEAQPRMGVRNLHNFTYCPRLFYFQWVENIFQESADTVAGSLVHRNVDQPSKLDDERAKALGENLPEGAKLRSLRLESESLGLIGVVDIVEGGPDGAEIIDYKKGSARRDSEGERVAKEPDALQVAAHALLLREHGVNAVGAAIYYAADKRRVPVGLTQELFDKVRRAIEDARALAAGGKCPPPLKNDARCLYCSAYRSVCRTSRSGGRNGARPSSQRTSFYSASPKSHKASSATRSLRRWISPPNPRAKNQHCNHRALAVTRARCWSCRRQARKSASAEMS